MFSSRIKRTAAVAAALAVCAVAAPSSASAEDLNFHASESGRWYLAGYSATFDALLIDTKSVRGDTAVGVWIYPAPFWDERDGYFYNIVRTQYRFDCARPRFRTAGVRHYDANGRLLWRDDKHVGDWEAISPDTIIADAHGAVCGKAFVERDLRASLAGQLRALLGFVDEELKYADEQRAKERQNAPTPATIAEASPR